MTQDSYIGSTSASQAEEAGSTPVSCSKNTDPTSRRLVGSVFLALAVVESNRAAVEMFII